MSIWTELDIINKLNEGWALSGDIGSDSAFGFINPSRQVLATLPAIPADIVRRLSVMGVLTPDPHPGKKYMYRKRG
jgi:hypothetical protein